MFNYGTNALALYMQSIQKMTFYSLFLFALLALVCSLAIASDPSPLHNFCVATKKSQLLVNGLTCKGPDIVNPEDFFFAGLDKSGNRNNYPWSNMTIVNAHIIPGFHTLGISIAHLDFAHNRGLNPPHTHPRATEVLAVMQGTLYVGFVTTAPNFKLVATILNKGDVFVFPEGLVHFQYNIGRTPAIAYAALSSQNPDVVPVAKTVFGSSQPISDDVLEKAFHLNMETVERLEDLFWSSN